MNWRETPAAVSRARAEQPLVFTGPKGALHGIFTPPAPDASPASACVVFPPATTVRGFAVIRYSRHESLPPHPNPSTANPSSPHP